MRIRTFSSHSRTAMTVVEVTVAAAIMSLLMGSLVLGISMLQRSFEASREHVKSQLEQARLIDYVSRDLRRALKVETNNNGTELTLTIPDFYDKTPGEAATPNTPVRTPTIVSGNVRYGTTALTIRYFKKTHTTGHADLIRSENGTETVVATDVQDFNLKFLPNSSNQEVTLSTSFRPRFRSVKASQEGSRAGTTATTLVLLRNKR